MSLINDALKKAQNLQTRPTGATPAFPRATIPVPPAGAATIDPASAPTTPAATSAPVPARKGKSPHSVLIIAVASTVLVVGLGAIGYVVYALFLSGTPEEQVIASNSGTPAIVQPATSAAPALAAIATASSAPDTPPPLAATPVSPPAAAPAPEAAPVGTVATSTPAPTPAPAVAPAPAAAAAASPPAPATGATTAPAPARVAAPVPVIAEEEEEPDNNPAPHIQTWVDKITVAGIRGGERPKALMNDRVFVVGDTVNRELGLKLLSIGDRLLVFRDAEGNTYEYTF